MDDMDDKIFEEILYFQFEIRFDLNELLFFEIIKELSIGSFK